MRERIGRDASLRLLLDAIVADGSRGIEASRDIGVGQPHDVACLNRVIGPNAGEAIGLQLGSDRATFSTDRIATFVAKEPK